MPKIDSDQRQHRTSKQRVISHQELESLVVQKKRKERNGLILLVMGIVVIALALLSFCVGRYSVSISDVFGVIVEGVRSLFSGETLEWSSTQSVIINIRLPRILAAMLVGAALAIAGASYQGVFRNPMVSSDILGASAGAGFGASIAILMGASAVVTQLAAFCCGLLAVGITYTIGNIVGRHDTTTLVLVLAGMVVQALFQAFVGCAKYVADPYSQLPEITYWLMGSLALVSYTDIALMLAPLAIGIVVLLALRWRINVLSFGDEEAQAMGLNTKVLRLVIIVCATLVTGSAISVAGQVGWLGLVVPHMARMIVGPNYKHLLPASLLLGSGFLLIVDNVARSAISAEIPLGILTAIIGAPVFVFLLFKGKKGWV